MPVHLKSDTQGGTRLWYELIDELVERGALPANRAGTARSNTPTEQGRFYDELRRMEVDPYEVARAIANALDLPLYRKEEVKEEVEKAGSDWMLAGGTLWLLNPVGERFSQLMRDELADQAGSVDALGVLPLTALDELSADEDFVFSQTDSSDSEREEDQALANEARAALEEIMAQAIRRNASDVHIRSEEDRVSVRVREDGRLVEIVNKPRHLSVPLANVILTKARKNAGTFREPISGEFAWDLTHRRISVRMEVIPAKGQTSLAMPKIVLRLLGLDMDLQKLDQLKMPALHMDLLKRTAVQPYGLVLVTGPTGSGKSTTLYAMLRHALSVHPDKAYYTVEDPVEQPLQGVDQIQINERSGLTWEAALRSLLRLDPDVIMAGEIRDEVTASLAIRAARTGHLVLSTLHVNTALQAIQRLVDLGIDQNQVSDTLSLVTGQRMIRKVCPDCSTEDSISNHTVAPDYYKGVSRVKVASEEGCSNCKYTGYAGRTALTEVFPRTRTFADMVSDPKGTPSADALERALRKEGYGNFHDYGKQMLKEGVTTVEELESVLPLPLGNAKDEDSLNGEVKDEVQG